MKEYTQRNTATALVASKLSRVVKRLYESTSKDSTEVIDRDEWIRFGLTLSGPLTITDADVQNMQAILNSSTTAQMAGRQSPQQVFTPSGSVEQLAK